MLCDIVHLHVHRLLQEGIFVPNVHKVGGKSLSYCVVNGEGLYSGACCNLAIHHIAQNTFSTPTQIAFKDAHTPRLSPGAQAGEYMSNKLFPLRVPAINAFMVVTWVNYFPRPVVQMLVHC